MEPLTTITGQYKGLYYEIGDQSNGGSYYSVWDVGLITSKKIELAWGSSCDKRYTVEYIKSVIDTTLEVTNEA